MATATEASQQANRSGMDPKRLVVIFFLIAGIILALFLDHVFGLLWARFGWADTELIEGLGWRVSSVVGFVVSAAILIGAYIHPTSHAVSIDVASELMKVTWPSWQETRTSTMAVVVASVVAAIILFGIDTLAYNLMVEWIPAIWGKL
ncbi:preprotein translocase subunit SecE [Myxococcaceae bacterium GXIMD 01537]